MATPLSPEIRLLIAACHVGADPPEFDEPIDPHTLLRLAIFHRVASLVYEHRARLNLPEDCMEAFRAATMATLHRNLQFAAELKIALVALKAANVPVILLKGAHLMDAVYHNPALRPISDLDLLVHPGDAKRSVLALRDAGYVTNGRKASFTLAADREIRLDKSDIHDVVIELHTDLNRPTRHHWFPMDQIWERSEPYPFEGTPVRALCINDNVSFLCAHAVPHAFSQLIWLRDIAGLAGACTPTLAGVALASRTRRATWAGLSLAADMMGAAVDQGLLAELAGPDSTALLGLITPDRLFAGTHYSTLESLRFRAVLSDNRTDAASIIGSGAVRKAGEMRRGLTTKKQN